jgi:hypothetical protein
VDQSTVGAIDRDLWNCDKWRGLEVLSAPGRWIGVRIAVAWDWGDVDSTRVVAGILWLLRTEFELGYDLILYHQLFDRSALPILAGEPIFLARHIGTSGLFPIFSRNVRLIGSFMGTLKV